LANTKSAASSFQGHAQGGDVIGVVGRRGARGNPPAAEDFAYLADGVNAPAGFGQQIENGVVGRGERVIAPVLGSLEVVPARAHERPGDHASDAVIGRDEQGAGRFARTVQPLQSENGGSSCAATWKTESALVYTMGGRCERAPRQAA
jgi:hypothetical protein